jgi:hypothetical protein
LNNKYIELENDIILNDEIFDEKGNPSGGDGVVYQWKSITQSWLLTILGNGYKISGIYYNRPNSSKVQFVGTSQLFDNIRFVNYFMQSNNEVYLLSGNVREITNCTFGKGYLVGKICSIVNYSNLIENCSTYATLIASDSGMGFSREARGNFINCKNYGNIIGDSWTNAGIAGQVFSSSVFKDCENYGVVQSKGTGGHIGGIVGIQYATKAKLKLINCKNYGTVQSLNSDNVGGMIGTAEGNVVIENCENNGLIISKSLHCGELIGLLMSSSIVTELTINNCKINSKSSKALIAGCACNKGIYLKITNSEINYENNKSLNGIIWNVEWINSTLMQVDLNNIIINIKNTKKSEFYLFNGLRKNTTVNIHNVILNSNLKTTCKNYITNLEYNCNFLSFLVTAGEDKVFYGSQFSDYFYDYKTGKIGLETMEGVGSFKAKVDENFLLNKNFKKLG